MKLEREVEISLNLNDLKDKLFKTMFTAAGRDYTVVKIIEEKQAILLFTPKKGFSAYHNSFAPTAEVYFKDNKMNVFCRLDKPVRFFKILWCVFCTIFLLAEVVGLIKGHGFVAEILLAPIGFGVYGYMLFKIGFYFSTRSFLKNLYGELGVDIL